MFCFGPASYAEVLGLTELLQQNCIGVCAKATDSWLLLHFETPTNDPFTTPETWRFGHRRNMTMKKIFAAAAVAAVLGLAACGQPATNAADAAGNVVDAAAGAAGNTVDAAAGAATDAAAATGNVVDAAAGMTGNAVDAAAATTGNAVDAAAAAATNAVAPK